MQEGNIIKNNSKSGFISKLRRTKIKRRKREKTIKKPLLKEQKHKKIKSTINKIDIKESSQIRSNNYEFEGRKIVIDEDEELRKQKVKIDINQDKIKSEKISATMISFNHELTEFEIKFKYLNLKDVNGRMLGRSFPPIRSRLVILDNEGRKFLMNKVGNNQISGDLITLIRANEFKPGDILTIGYDPEEEHMDGRFIIHIKSKKASETES